MPTIGTYKLVFIPYVVICNLGQPQRSIFHLSQENKMRVSFSIFFPFPTPDTNLLQLLFKRLGMNGAIPSLKIAYFLKVGIKFFQATYYLFI
jgi:hypothetical protein